jgi:glycosyltransferase involved in cell wall biosynthesis
MQQTPEVSIVISTYNRAARLPGALDALLAQDAPGLPYEIIVVDNNSSDHTRQVIETFQTRSGGRVRYVFEGRQGVSYGRNAGVQKARAALLAFTDDDMRMAADWVAQVRQALATHPEWDYAGGRVWPRWSVPPPAWLTPRHWGPVALLDYGAAPLPIDAANQRALVTANFAIRRAAFEACGGFSPLTQRTTSDVCSTEDHELLLRLWQTGARGAYVPQLLGWAEVPALRLTKQYHRRWHRGHGRCLALLREDSLEQTRRGQWFGVPAHLYRQTLRHAVDWLLALPRGAAAEAFWCETRLWFALGFGAQRYRDHLTAGRTGAQPLTFSRLPQESPVSPGVHDGQG